MSDLIHEKKLTIRNEKHRLMINLMLTSQYLSQSFNTFLKPFDLSAQQFNILRILRGAKDWLPMNEVKKRMIEHSPNTTRLVDKMLAKEIIRRERCPDDRRVVYVKITQKGLDILEEIDKLEPDHFQLLNKISEEEASLAADVLEKIRT